MWCILHIEVWHWNIMVQLTLSKYTLLTSSNLCIQEKPQRHEIKFILSYLILFPDTTFVLYMQSLSAIKACLKKGIRYLSNNYNYLSMICYYVFVKIRAAPCVSCQSLDYNARYSIVYITAQTGKQLASLANALKRDRKFHHTHIVKIIIES